MNTLFSTTAFIGQMGYQKPSNHKLQNISHKKANFFRKFKNEK